MEVYFEFLKWFKIQKSSCLIDVRVKDGSGNPTSLRGGTTWQSRGLKRTA
jgi:hypothetical protein